MKVKIGVVGGSIQSAVGKAHIYALRLTNKFEITCGTFSRIEKINNESADFYGIEKKYSSIENLISNEKKNIDFILILTPTNKHYDHIKLCLNNNINVISEKALTTSYKRAEELIKICKEKKLQLFVTYNYTGYPIVRDIRNIICKKKLGEILFINLEMPQESFIKIDKKNHFNAPQKWRKKDYNIATITLDLGVHLFAFLNFFKVKYNYTEYYKECSFGHVKKVIDDVNMILNINNNKYCKIWYSKVALGNNNGMKISIFFDKGSIEWNQKNPEILKLANENGTIKLIERGDEMLEISNQERYNRFKSGHPHGYIEAFSNYYESIYLQINGQDDGFIDSIEDTLSNFKNLSSLKYNYDKS